MSHLDNTVKERREREREREKRQSDRKKAKIDLQGKEEEMLEQLSVKGSEWPQKLSFSAEYKKYEKISAHNL